MDKKEYRALLAGVFIISFSLLSFEITVTRLLSVAFLYHYVFIVVSLALLGLGAGGIFVHFRFRPPENDNGLARLARSASLVAISIPPSVLLMVVISYAGFSASLVLYGALLFVPFFLTGALFAEAFRLFPQLSARVYGADLVGAALGAIGVIFFLNSLGGINTGVFLGVTTSVAALVFALGARHESLRTVTLATGSLLLTIALLGINLQGNYLPDIPIAGVNPEKEMAVALTEPSYRGEIIDSRWSAFGRTDLVAFSQRPEQMRIYIDGTAGSPMYRFNGDIAAPGEEINQLKETFTGYFPFFFLKAEERNSALVIGSGGGRDILLALMGGVEKITAVEVDPDLVAIVRDYAWYNGGIFTNFPNVTAVVDEGRNFLKRQKEKYDLIFLSLPVTQTSRSLEGYSLTENFLLTTESIGDYLDHLTPEGQLVLVSHDDFTIWKMFAVSLAALQERDISPTTAMEHIYVLGLSSPGTYPLFVLKKAPLTSAEASVRQEKIRQLGYDPSLSYFPHITEKGQVNLVLLDLSRGRITLNEVEENLKRNVGIDISAVTDNRPFFYKIDAGLPSQVLLTLWLSITTMVLVLLAPILSRRLRSSRQERRSPARKAMIPIPLQALGLFAFIGIGFMLVEISLIQRFTLFLGQPVLSLAVVLALLLVSSGLGSLYSGRIATEKIPQRIALSSAVIVAIIVVYAFLLPLVLERLLGLPLAARSLVTAVFLFPLGFFMGNLFPLGIRWLKETKTESYIPWLWGVNGVGSVLGSVATIAIAISSGFTQAFLAGAACYLLVFVLFRGTRYTVGKNV